MQKTLSGTLESLVDLVPLQRMLSSWRPVHGPLDVLELKGTNVSVHSAARTEHSRLVMQRECLGSPKQGCASSRDFLMHHLEEQGAGADQRRLPRSHLPINKDRTVTASSPLNSSIAYTVSTLMKFQPVLKGGIQSIKGDWRNDNSTC